MNYYFNVGQYEIFSLLNMPEIQKKFSFLCLQISKTPKKNVIY